MKIQTFAKKLKMFENWIAHETLIVHQIVLESGSRAKINLLNPMQLFKITYLARELRYDMLRDWPVFSIFHKIENVMCSK